MTIKTFRMVDTVIDTLRDLKPRVDHVAQLQAEYAGKPHTIRNISAQAWADGGVDVFADRRKMLLKGLSDEDLALVDLAGV